MNAYLTTPHAGMLPRGALQNVPVEGRRGNPPRCDLELFDFVRVYLGFVLLAKGIRLLVSLREVPVTTFRSRIQHMLPLTPFILLSFKPFSPH